MPFIPFTIYYIVNKIRNKEGNYKLYFIITLAFYTLLLLVLCLTGKISTYYYYKIYYLIWPFIIYASTEGIISLYNKHKTVLEIISILIIITYVFAMIFSIYTVKYEFPGGYYKEKEGISTIMGIFNINKRLLETGTIVSEDALECIKFMNNNVDSSKALCISHKRQEEWKDILIVNSKSHIMDYDRMYEEIRDWNNGKYQYLVILNQRIYKMLENEIKLDNTKILFENETTKVYEKAKWLLIEIYKLY